MKTIDEIWDELRNHPEYVTGSLWTIEDIAINYEYIVKNYLVDELKIEEIDEYDIEKYSLEIVKNNIELFKKAIEILEAESYGSYWEIEIDELNLPEFEVNEIL